MSTFPSFIELLVKQTCRRASYEFEMGSRQSTENSTIYSLEFLKTLYDKPRENIHKLLKVKDMSPPKSQQWIDLQHYMHYVYRNFVNANPDPSAEALSSFFVSEIKELVKSLMQEDESQLYLRILALLREYCIFAQWNYSKADGEHAITMIIYKNYSVCWIDFNTCVFINYFFETEYVKNKIYQCLETRISPGDTPAMFGLLDDLKNLWIREQRRIMKLNEGATLDDFDDLYDKEEQAIAAHKRLLSSNFWVDRSMEELSELNLSRLDHQIFRLLGDPTFHPAGPILDRHGQCICEECLIAKYKCILDYNQDQFGDKLLKNVQRLSYCRRCQSLVDLDFFHRHINSHAVSNLDNKASFLNMSTNLSRIISEKIDFVKLGNGSLNLPDLVATEQPLEKEPFIPPIEKTPNQN
ncbi:hypothetical protein NQ318_001747 [Aromia moschata]|uniref:Uncharacterized protein n=1 Tax=Aromia moschata TaxID=1265417 RepID=A0AAV8XVW9_9CUCU|nr:hypothetical protein NQ318_001747 [Aromia moschata]